MRRFLIGLLPALLVAGVGLSTVASAHDEAGEHLQFIAKPTSFHMMDLDGGAAQVVVAFDLFEHKDKMEGDHKQAAQYRAGHDHADARAGHATATCITSDPDAGRLCSAAVELDNGQLAVQGLVTFSSHAAAGKGGGHNPLVLPVTGGSGDYFGAAGEVEISHARHGDDAGKEDGDGYGPMAFPASDHKPHHKGHALLLTFHLQ